MQNNKGRRTATGRSVGSPTATSPVYTPEQQETLRRGLRILARIITRAHLRRKEARCEAMPGSANREGSRTAFHGPPPKRNDGE